MQTTGGTVDPQPDARTETFPAPRWWQTRALRLVVALAVVALLAAPMFVWPRGAHHELHLGGGLVWDLRIGQLDWYVGLALMPVLRQVAHRKRDVLIIGLVPIYGWLVVAAAVTRLMALPRRDWPPRPDEIPRVVPAPDGRSYRLARDLGLRDR